VTNLHVAVREWNDEIVFLYRIQNGRADRSYGIHVAKIAGLPPKAIERAKSLLETLSVQHESGARESASKLLKKAPQMSLFTEYLEHPAMEELRTLKLEAMSPMEAFDALRKLKEQAE
jgi:DNA mismatch repair protein MutS